MDLPAESDLNDVLDLDLSATAALSVTVFLNRKKFGSKFDHAFKVRAEAELHEKKDEKLTLEELTTETRQEFGRLARSYVTHLFEDTRSQFDFTTMVAQGLDSIDLVILLKSPQSLATMCCGKLLMTFRLRWYFTADQETPAQEEFLSFADEVRASYADFDQPTLLIPDTIDFLLQQTTLQTRTLLLQCSKLACLC